MCDTSANPAWIPTRKVEIVEKSNGARRCLSPIDNSPVGQLDSAAAVRSNTLRVAWSIQKSEDKLTFSQVNPPGQYLSVVKRIHDIQPPSVLAGTVFLADVRI